MTEKKSILLLAATAALTFALHEDAFSAPPVNEVGPRAVLQTTIVEPTGPVASQNPTPGHAPVTRESTSDPEPMPQGSRSPDSTSPDQTAAPPPPLPASAATVPPQAPTGAPTGPSSETSGPSPSQIPLLGKGDAKAAGMPPEERNILRERRFQQMRERVMKRHQEMAARWDSYWKILDAMTPEQKEAVHAIFGRRHQHCPPYAMGRQTPPGMPPRPSPSQPEFGYPSGFGFPGGEYGYGPQGVEPYPLDRGTAAPWLDEQPRYYYPGGTQPWLEPDQGAYQGPPPPNAAYPRP